MTQAQMEGLKPDLWEPVVMALPAAHLNFMHLKIPEEDLMNDEEIAQVANHNLQVGFVQLLDILEMDHGWVAQPSLDNKRSHLDSIRLWGRHFAPIGNVVGPQVPGSWSDFFTIALMDPIIFGWAKSFMESMGCKMLLEEDTNSTCLTFYIPKKCPSDKPLECLNSAEPSEALTPQK
jgi:hypothetical protein